MSAEAAYLYLDDNDRFLRLPGGDGPRPVWQAQPCPDGGVLVALDPQGRHWAQRVSQTVLTEGARKHPEWALGTVRRWAADRVLSRASVLLRHRESTCFHPRTGARLIVDEFGVGREASTAERSSDLVFPRIDPAVIGVVEHPTGDRILLARNKRPGRSHYFSLIAGYVEAGESLEQALIREIAEETGFRAEIVTYVGSQAWAPGGSVMAGFLCRAMEATASGVPDGELAEIGWFSREDLDDLPLPGEGSLARRLILRWRSGAF